MSFSAQQTVDVEATAKFIPVASVSVASLTTEHSISGVMVKFGGSAAPAVSCYTGSEASPVSCSDATSGDKTVIGMYL